MIDTDDENSIYILQTIAQARLRPASGELPPNADIRAALATSFGDSGPTPATEGNLARAALNLLAQDPAFAEPIQVMASQSGISASRQRYLEPSTIALITAVLLVLQTRIKFKLDYNRKWSVEVDKKSSSDAAVKLLVQRLLSFLNK
jgi:hypothetical protein